MLRELAVGEKTRPRQPLTLRSPGFDRGRPGRPPRHAPDHTGALRGRRTRIGPPPRPGAVASGIDFTRLVRRRRKPRTTYWPMVTVVPNDALPRASSHTR